MACYPRVTPPLLKSLIQFTVQIDECSHRSKPNGSISLLVDINFSFPNSTHAKSTRNVDCSWSPLFLLIAISKSELQRTYIFHHGCNSSLLSTQLSIILSCNLPWVIRPSRRILLFYMNYIPTDICKTMALTHWDRNEKDSISQTTFSNVFSSMKMFGFQLTFHWKFC